ncbi:hypothetical protein BURK1_00102 [Burkholderiales bacterium]|nr:hypothetical protein BURK1_00102 [Burkholderiales bacterium]
MIDRYVETVRALRTVNQFNRFHLELEGVLGPAEFADLADRILAFDPPLPDAGLHWARALRELLARSGRAPQAMPGYAIAPMAHFYRSGNAALPRESRTLVVCFTDAPMRMMMPLPLFLQHCPSTAHDYLVLRDPRRAWFLDGIDGLGGDVPGIAASLDRLASPRAYRRAVTLGVSAGGLAAWWTAIALGFARAVSVGGTLPESIIGIPAAGGRSTAGFDDLVQARGGALPELVYVYGEDHGHDREKAALAAARVPATLVAVPSVGRHNVFYDTFLRGELAPLLERLIS